MAKYVYPVVITPENDGMFSSVFPDLEGCYTQGDDLADVIDASGDVLALVLYGLEEKKADIPAASGINSISKKENEIVSLVSADTMEYRKLYDSKAVKKTLTIPAWLNTEAEKEGVNFSQILQNGLKEYLHV